MANDGEDARRLIGGRYQLLGRVGAGAGGTVFAARDRAEGRTVALKRLRDADPLGVTYFKREFRYLADASHPNLVTLHELFVDECDFYLSMEFVRGVSITEYLRPGTAVASGPLSRRQVIAPTFRAADSARAYPDRVSADERVSATPIALDWDRVRRTFAQLADALMALHEAGIFHRDLKPSNVLVADSGRVVVLDFGLIAKMHPAAHSAGQFSLVGTPAYMAPEPCLGSPYEAASDWYSVGVVLYEVLTGGLPHGAANLGELIEEKARGSHLAVATRNSAVPEDLASLCHDLLQCDPSARPPGSAVRERLDPSTGSAPRRAVPPSRRSSIARAAVPIGRNVELAVLEGAFDTSARGTAVLVRIEGVSGVGKSTIVETFVEQLERHTRALVLRGRCYQREFLPYKAIDGVVDELSEYLAHLEPGDVQRLLPAHTADLARVFTVLAQLPAIVASTDVELEEDPAAVKRGAFAALRELLARIARERAVVIFIDDVHWGDLDSVDVVEELLRPPAAPPLLLVVAFRSEERTNSPFVEALRARIGGSAFPLEIRDLSVCPLPPSASQQLAEALLGSDDPADADLARRIAEESEGHPLLIEELTRHAVSLDPGAPIAGSSVPGSLLTHVINQRVGELPPHLRSLLDAVALAGAPINMGAACRAAGMGGIDQAAVQQLLVQHFLRAHRGTESDQVTPYHDRIREAVVDSLASIDRRRLHRALGDALLRQEHVPPHVLMTHFEGAGELATAARHAAAAAEQAAHTLAFNEAAELYRKALAWDPGPPDAARRLRSRYADALFNQGLCRAAAAVYAEAARGAGPGESGALRTRAALSFMTCGAVEEGGPLMREVLREVGVADPRSRTRAFLQLALSLGRLQWRGLRYRPHAEGEVDAAARRRIDTCYAAAHAFILHDMIRSAGFFAAGLLRALDAGDRDRLIEGCALVGGFAASFRWRLGEHLIVLTRRLADELDTPFAHGISHLAQALRCIMQDDPGRGLEHADAACQLLDRCAGVTTVQQYAQIQRVLILRSLERFADLEVSSERNLRWAREVGNPYFEAAAHMESVLPRLARGDVHGARAHLGEALQRASPNDGYVVHSGLTMRVKCDLYEGRWQHAHQQVEGHWGALRRGGMLTVPVAKEFYGGLRAGVALEVAVRDPGRRAAARRVARKGLRYLQRAQSDFGRGCRAAILAAMASDENRTQEAIALCREASSHFSRASFPVRAAALARRAAELAGARDGMASADQEMTALGVVDPVRWTRSVAPGFRVEEAR
jgi:eukaryotic-like serine/threonine-protein kinase